MGYILMLVKKLGTVKIKKKSTISAKAYSNMNKRKKAGTRFLKKRKGKGTKGFC